MRRKIARGRPLSFFAILMLGWTGMRVVTFELPWPAVEAPDAGPPVLYLATAKPVTPLAPPADSARPPHRGIDDSPRERDATIIRDLPVLPPILPQPERALPPPPDSAPPLAEQSPFAPGRHAAGHNLAWLAAMANLPMPASVAALIDRRREEAERRAAASRWRVDGWLLLRQGGTQLSPAGTPAPSYGASQIGAVLAYRLAPQSAHRPAAYLRASRALVHGGEGEGALGLSLRPFPALPVTAHVELRATHRPGDGEVRGAAFLAGGFDRLRLPLGVRASGYAQVGYVGGNYATAFADGKLVAEREVAHFDLGRISAGAGMWGGAQKGAERLDVGPSASLDVTLADAPARLSIDYRQRVAGGATPASGGVLTLSTGF